MAKYIDRDAIREEFNNRGLYGTELFDSFPTADVAPVKHGKWSKVYSNKVATVYECSNCGHITLGASEYCICGAKMDLEE